MYGSHRDPHVLPHSFPTRLSSDLTGKGPTPLGTANRMSAPYQAVEASDGYFVMGATNNKLWKLLCDTIGRPELLADERFKDIASRLANREILKIGRAHV